MSNFSDDALSRLQNMKSQIELFCNQGSRICEDAYDVKLGFDALGSNEFASILDSLHSKISEAISAAQDSATRIDDITNQIDQRTPDLTPGDNSISIEFEDDLDAQEGDLANSLDDSIAVDNLGDTGLVASTQGRKTQAFMVGDKVTFSDASEAAEWGPGVIAEINDWATDGKDCLVNFNNVYTDTSLSKLVAVE